MKIVVTGATGQLGTEVVNALAGEQVDALGRLELDLCDFVYARTRISGIRPDVVVNAAAFTRVDDCETEPERAFWVNTYAVRNLAQVCADVGCVLAHVSTDYVFDGMKSTPYTEDDVPNPLSVYGTSKLAGEYFVRNLVPRHYVIRTSGLYGRAGAASRRGNFVDRMLRLADEHQPIRVVDDHVLTPSSARDVARKIVDVLRTDRFGLYHVTNAGQCSWFDFARAIFALAGAAPHLEPATTTRGARARRPRYSVLAHTRLAAMGADDLPSWEEALAAYLRERDRLASPAAGRGAC